MGFSGIIIILTTTYKSIIYALVSVFYYLNYSGVSFSTSNSDFILEIPFIDQSGYFVDNYIVKKYNVYCELYDLQAKSIVFY